MIIICASATGSPGVTTSALGLTLQWPTDVLLAECDTHPSQSILAGYLRGISMAGLGISELIKTHRKNQPIINRVLEYCTLLSQNEPTVRKFLPGFTTPGAPELFKPLWGELADAFIKIDRAEMDVIIDFGRLPNQGLPNELLSISNVFLLFVRSSLRSLVGLQIYLSNLKEQLASFPGQAELALVVIGSDKPYSASEISAQFSCPVWFSIPIDTSNAEILSDGKPVTRKFKESALLRSYRDGASRIIQKFNSSKDVLES